MTQSKKSKKPELWAEAKRKCRLNLEEVKMAQALGLNPKKLIANHASCRQEAWKTPIGEWIWEIHEKRFGQQKNQAQKAVVVEPPGENPSN
ncbi:MAG: hypothetical protein WCA35_30950 [Kovacikia sp.]